MRDPYSERSKRRGAKEAKKSQEGKGGPAPTNLSKGGGKGEGSLTAVRETSFPTFLENKISALDGTNLRRLRDGMGLRPPPGIIIPGERNPGPVRIAIRNDLLEICNPDLLPPGQLRSTSLLGVLQEEYLDKVVRKLTDCLSEFPGKTAGPVIRKPQRFCLKFLSALSDLANGTGKDFINNLENRATVGYETNLGN